MQETKAKLKLDCTEISKREREKNEEEEEGWKGRREERDRGREGKKERRGKMKRNLPDAVR